MNEAERDHCRRCNEGYQRRIRHLRAENKQLKVLEAKKGEQKSEKQKDQENAL